MAHSLMIERNSQNQDKYIIRFPPGMRDRIKSIADMMRRSMNAEIILRLERSFEESEKDLVKLDLPGDVWNSLMVDASLHNCSMAERAVEIIRGAFDATAGYSLALEKLAEITAESGEKDDIIQELRRNEDTDFLLYYGKVMQLRQFVALIMSEDDIDLPANIRGLADELNEVCKSEIDLLRDRHTDAMFRRKMKEHAQATSLEIQENTVKEI